MSVLTNSFQEGWCLFQKSQRLICIGQPGANLSLFQNQRHTIMNRPHRLVWRGGQYGKTPLFVIDSRQVNRLLAFQSEKITMFLTVPLIKSSGRDHATTLQNIILEQWTFANRFRSCVNGPFSFRKGNPPILKSHSNLAPLWHQHRSHTARRHIAAGPLACSCCDGFQQTIFLREKLISTAHKKASFPAVFIQMPFQITIGRVFTGLSRLRIDEKVFYMRL